ncbi:hypothetical protein SAMN02745857_04012 [Andreprevotia lacus DSM 23236]|jgi:hypothetical protein|uniref:Uncharacterized protein n=1 Tax=Andreprevotia lacus DSM 23236 TaxID=1121001 RepID=A0A1W1Y1N9_9NEIS|nr:hypothetical protein [Andreprevotia lacus]SMC29678.1 hypothetical protein SAMN02745857_04012 [Andreprevotia lacus DSM 23236]
MRTYDKQIETIQTGQGNGALRSSFGMVSAAAWRVAPAVAAPQDTA